MSRPRFKVVGYLWMPRTGWQGEHRKHMVLEDQLQMHAPLTLVELRAWRVGKPHVPPCSGSGNHSYSWFGWAGLSGGRPRTSLWRCACGVLKEDDLRTRPAGQLRPTGGRGM